MATTAPPKPKQKQELSSYRIKSASSLPGSPHTVSDVQYQLSFVELSIDGVAVSGLRTVSADGRLVRFYPTGASYFLYLDPESPDAV